MEKRLCLTVLFKTNIKLYIDTIFMRMSVRSHLYLHYHVYVSVDIYEQTFWIFIQIYLIKLNHVIALMVSFLLFKNGIFSSDMQSFEIQTLKTVSQVSVSTHDASDTIWNMSDKADI